MRSSSINSVAIDTAVGYATLFCDNDYLSRLYSYECECLSAALKKEPSSMLTYMLLRCRYIMNSCDESLLHQAKALFLDNPSSKAALLYFQIAISLNIVSDALECLEKYGQIWASNDCDEQLIELLMFYSKFGFYEEGYSIVEKIYKSYKLDKYICSALIECCLRTGQSDEISEIISEVLEMKECPDRRMKIRYRGKNPGS